MNTIFHLIHVKKNRKPYSAFINVMNCFIIVYFLNKTKTNHSFYLLGSILLFEMFHTLSHIIHINGPIQINITHVLNYLMIISFLFYFILKNSQM
jgi:hypothetical protein